MARNANRETSGRGRRETSRQEPDNVRGAYRICEAPGCGKRYPAYVARQRFCSPVCRARAFYWDFKDTHGERYGARYERAARKNRAVGRGRARSGAAGSSRRARNRGVARGSRSSVRTNGGSRRRARAGTARGSRRS